MAKHKIPNAPQVQNLYEFLSVLNKEWGYASQDRFLVVFNKNLDRSLERDLMYLCNETELPGRKLVAGNEIRYNGPSFKVPVISQYDTISFSFIVRDFMSERYYFDKWMDKINPKSTYDFAYRTEYETQVDIFQYGEHFTGNKNEPMQATYKLSLRHAWPISVSSMPLSWSEEGLHKLTVEFTYSDWFNNEEEAKRKLNADLFQLVDGASVRR